MLRRVGMVGLAVPLLAVVAALVFLLVFGTDAPTFDAAAADLARDHTVVRLSDDPDAAIVVPADPPESVAVVVILADDQRHVWSAAKDLGLLDHVESASLALLIAPGVEDAPAIASLVEAVEQYVPVNLSLLAAFDGAPIRSLCDDAARVIVVGDGGSCADAVTLPSGDDLGARIVNAVRRMRAEASQ